MSFIESDNALNCILPQRLDTLNSQQFEIDLNNKIETNNSKIIFDFKDVSFVSSYFLRICLTTFQKKSNDNFELINVKSEIKKVFMIAGFDKHFNIK
jgi:anti-anti-sigma factor